MYSNALQTLAFVQYVIEFPAAGGAVVSSKIQCMKLAQLYVLQRNPFAMVLLCNNDNRFFVMPRQTVTFSKRPSTPSR
jgi:hypothetical protein